MREKIYEDSKERNKLQILIQIMSFQKNDQSDFDFSIIDKKPPQQAKLNFSVQSLLSQHRLESCIQQKQPSHNRTYEQMIGQLIEQVQVNRVQAENGSFLQDLQKMEQQLSFETQLYNVYQQETQTLNSNSLNPLTKSYLHAKSNSHLKTTKQDSNTQSLDDYGYLVLNFAVKRKKSSKMLQNQEHINKLNTQQQNSLHKLKSSRSSGALSIREQSSHAKSGFKKSLNKLFSPRKVKQNQLIIKNNEIRVSKQKNMTKSSVTKNKETPKQSKRISDKVTNKVSKSKSPFKKLQIHSIHDKNTNISTTIAQTSIKTNKSSAKSMRQANVYSQYYGFQELGTSEKFVTKSNCLSSSSSGSQKNLLAKRNVNVLFKKSSSKSNCKKTFNSPSPSHKDLSMRFKKKVKETK